MKLPFTLAALLPLVAAAQAPTLTTLAPARNAVAAPRTGAISATFSAPVTGASGLRVQGTGSGGQRTVTASGDGTATLRLQPARAFTPGERVRVSVPATVRGTGAGTPAVAASTYEFRAAAGPATGTFTMGALVRGSGFSGLHDPLLLDANNDGNLDLVVADQQNTGDLRLALGNGQGGFGTSANLGAGVDATGVATGDFNEDGNLDLVSGGFRNGTYALMLLTGNGRGAFAQGATLPSTAIPLRPCVGDVNADGHADVVFIGYAPTTTPSGPARTELRVGLGNGAGGFSDLPALALPFLGTTIYPPQALFLADLNNDGHLDCLVTNSSTGMVYSYQGDGLGGFAAVGSGTALGAMLTLADLTGDGTLDAVSTTTGTVQVYAGTGIGGFAATAVGSFATTGASAAHAADMDGDGDLDLLVAEASTPVRTLRLWRNNGTGTFMAGNSLTGMAGDVTTGDLNNDGTLDVAVADNRGDSFGPFIGVGLNAALATAPTLASFTPALAPAGTVVTLTGTNFAGATTVLVGGVPVSGFTVVNGTTITFVVPAGATGLITVITPTGTGTSATALRNGLAARATATAWAVALYPNPAHGTATVQVPAVAGAARVELYLCNALGQVVRRFPAANLPAAGLRLDFDVSEMAPGLYTLHLAAGAATTTQQLAVE